MKRDEYGIAVADPMLVEWPNLGRAIRVLSGMKPRGKSRQIGAYAETVDAIAKRADQLEPKRWQGRDWTAIGRTIRWGDSEANIAATLAMAQNIASGSNAAAEIAAWWAVINASIVPAPARLAPPPTDRAWTEIGSPRDPVVLVWPTQYSSEVGTPALREYGPGCRIFAGWGFSMAVRS